MIQEIYFASPLKLHPNIGIQILQSVLFTFPMVLTTRIVQRSGPSLIGYYLLYSHELYI